MLRYIPSTRDSKYKIDITKISHNYKLAVLKKNIPSLMPLSYKEIDQLVKSDTDIIKNNNISTVIDGYMEKQKYKDKSSHLIGLIYVITALFIFLGVSTENFKDNNIIYREIIKELNFLLDQKSIHDIEEKLCNTDKNNHISNLQKYRELLKGTQGLKLSLLKKLMDKYDGKKDHGQIVENKIRTLGNKFVYLNGEEDHRGKLKDISFTSNNFKETLKTINSNHNILYQFYAREIENIEKLKDNSAVVASSGLTLKLIPVILTSESTRIELESSGTPAPLSTQST